MLAPQMLAMVRFLDYLATSLTRPHKQHSLMLIKLELLEITPTQNHFVAAKKNKKQISFSRLSNVGI
jgi:hypothetical protein